MSTFRSNIISLLRLLPAAALLLAAGCKDDPAIDPQTPEGDQDKLTFGVPAMSDGWKGMSRAPVSSDPLWMALKEHDNRPYPADFIDKDVKYEPVFPTTDYDWDNDPAHADDKRFNDGHLRNYMKGDEHNGPYINHPVVGPGYLLALNDASGEGMGRIRVTNDTLTTEKLARLRGTSCAGTPQSRTELVTADNIRRLYNEVGVTSMCYYDRTEQGQQFDGNPTNLLTLTRERVAFAGGDTWMTTSSTWFWNEIFKPGNRVRFFSWAPYNLLNNENATFHETRADATPAFDYVIDQDPRKHVDIAATAIDCPGNFYNSVPLEFNHLLTGVRFLIDDQFMATKVKRITVRGVYDHGTYTFSTSPTSISKKDGTKKGDQGKWTPTGEHNAEFTYTVDNGDICAPYPDPLDTDEDRWCVVPEDRMWLMMPQMLQEGAEIEIEFDESLLDIYPTVIWKGRIDQIASLEDAAGSPTHPSGPDKHSCEWQAGHIITYLISTYDIEYVLKLVKDGGRYPYSGGFDDLTVVSYALYYKHGSTTLEKIRAIPWVPVFYDKDENEVPTPDWVDVTFDRPKGYPEFFYPGQAEESLGGETPLPSNDPTTFNEKYACFGHVKVKPQYTLETDPHHRALVTATPRGTADNPVDLSSDPERQITSSANCYIINAPGYYSLPLVYGNSLKCGGANMQAYDGLNFKNSYGDIKATGPWLKDAGTIKDATWISTNVENAVQLVSLTDERLVIYVDSAHIDQGNTHLAVRDANGDIMWSWHIWTTDYNPYAEGQTRRLVNAHDLNDVFQVMTVNVGWHYPELGGNNPERAVMWRPAQQCRHTGDKVVVRTTPNYYRIWQPPYESTQSGFAPYYNWGRKDPLLKAVHTPPDKPLWADGSAYFLTYDYYRITDNQLLSSGGFNLSDGHWYYMQPMLTTAVKVPWFIPDFYRTDNSGATTDKEVVTWWTGNSSDFNYGPQPIRSGSGALYPQSRTMASYNISAYADLWSANQKGSNPVDLSNFLVNTANKVVKTVYDPCPPGFCVAPSRALSSLDKSRATKSIHDGWSFTYDYLRQKSAISIGYTFFISSQAKWDGDESDAATINLPATAFLAARWGTYYSDGTNRYWAYGFPALSAYHNEMCTLWTADVAYFAEVRSLIGGIYNINSDFLGSNGLPGGPGETSFKMTDHTSQFNLWHSDGRQVRAVREAQ